MYFKFRVKSFQDDGLVKFFMKTLANCFRSRSFSCWQYAVAVFNNDSPTYYLHSVSTTFKKQLFISLYSHHNSILLSLYCSLLFNSILLSFKRLIKTPRSHPAGVKRPYCHSLRECSLSSLVQVRGKCQRCMVTPPPKFSPELAQFSLLAGQNCHSSA